MNNNLKPCPCCASKEVVIETRTTELIWQPWKAKISCKECGVNSGWLTGNTLESAKWIAEAAWNRRNNEAVIEKSTLPRRILDAIEKEQREGFDKGHAPYTILEMHPATMRMFEEYWGGKSYSALRSFQTAYGELVFWENNRLMPDEFLLSRPKRVKIDWTGKGESK